jgi:hypothetical protein
VAWDGGRLIGMVPAPDRQTVVAALDPADPGAGWRVLTKADVEKLWPPARIDVIERPGLLAWTGTALVSAAAGGLAVYSPDEATLRSAPGRIGAGNACGSHAATAITSAGLLAWGGQDCRGGQTADGFRATW